MDVPSKDDMDEDIPLAKTSYAGGSLYPFQVYQTLCYVVGGCVREMVLVTLPILGRKFACIGKKFGSIYNFHWRKFL